MDLSEIVGGSLYAFALVSVRIGAAFLVMPAIGEQFVSARVRVIFALLTAVVVSPVVRPLLPPEPDNAGDLTVLIVSEALVGVFIGTIARMLFTAVETAGSITANQLGLSAAQAFNPTLQTTGTVISAMMGLIALVLIFVTELHHMLILAVVDSYSLFTPAEGLPLADASSQMARIVSKSFLIGLQMAGPFVVVGLLFYLGIGLIARLVPQIQIFFVGVPVQIALGTALFSLSLSAIMLYWLMHFEDQLIYLLRP